MQRRQFLTLTASAPLLLTPFRPAMAGRWDRVLVLVELNGGNDGLNTVVPHGDPLYGKLRPNLAIDRQKVLHLDEQLGFHPALKPLMPLWQEQRLAVALGLGYPDPNLSHFRSIEIWDTASDSDAYLDDGWVAGLFRASPPGAGFTADGVVLGRDDVGPLQGERFRSVTLRDPKAFLNQARRMRPARTTAANPALQHLVGVQNQLRGTAQAFRERNILDADPGATFAKDPFGRQMETVARLLVSGVSVPVIKVSLGSFDTHANQAGTHARLLGNLAEGLTAFAKSMRARGLWNRVLVMTYGEFGRRVAENGSRGTDHGTAAPHFLLGGRVRGGFYGEQPPLNDLERGNLKYRLHFRSLYATAARDWWKMETVPFNEPSLDCII